MNFFLPEKIGAQQENEKSPTKSLEKRMRKNRDKKRCDS
jgi:hypothetical protein